MLANVLCTFWVLRFRKTMNVIVQILPFHPSICCANRHGLSKYCFNPSQCSPCTSTRSTVLIPQLRLVCMFTSHLNTVTMERTNKQTGDRKGWWSHFETSLYSTAGPDKFAAICAEGIFNCDTWVCGGGGEGVGVGGATQMAIAIVKRNQSNKNTVHTCRSHTACVNKICILERGEVFSLRKDGNIAT